MSGKIYRTILLLTVSAVLIGTVVIGSRRRSFSEGKRTPMILYFSSTCPHCTDTLAWMKTNGIGNRFSITLKELQDNQANSDELMSAAGHCGVSDAAVAIPFLLSEGRCLNGQDEVIGYFSRLAGIHPTERKTP